MRTACALVTVVIWVRYYLFYRREVRRQEISPSLGFWLTISLVDWVTLMALLAARVSGLSLCQLAVWSVGASCLAVQAWRLRAGLRLDGVEYACLVGSLLGVLIWRFTKDPALAALVQAGTMLVATSAFCRNALRGNEQVRASAIPLAAAITGLGTVGQWSLADWPALLVPVLSIIINGGCFACVVVGCRRAKARADILAPTAEEAAVP